MGDMSAYANNPNVRALPNGGYWVRCRYLGAEKEVNLLQIDGEWRAYLRDGDWKSIAPASAPDDYAIARLLG